MMDMRIGEHTEPSLEIKQLLYGRDNNIHFANNFIYFLGLIIRRKLLRLFSKSIPIYHLIDSVAKWCLYIFETNISKVIISKKIKTIHILNIHESIKKIAEIELDNVNRIIFTSWGTNLSIDVNSEYKLKLLKKVFAVSTHYAGESKNDLKIASEIGFKGQALPSFPFYYFRNVDVQTKIHSKQDNQILIRAADNDIIYFGIILEAIKKINKKDSNLRFIVYGIQNSIVIEEIIKLKTEFDIKIDYYMKNELGHNELKSLFQASKVYLLISKDRESIESILDALESENLLILYSNHFVLNLQSQGLSGTFINEMDPSVIAKELLEVMKNVSLLADAPSKNLKILGDIFNRRKFYDTIREYYEL
jgi:hypothetical protein